MDLTSYIIGKKSGGGGGSTDRKWSEIGYSSEPSYIQEGFDYAKQIKDNWDSSKDLRSVLRDDKNLIYMPFVNIGKTQSNASNMFYNCYKLEEVPLLDFSNITNMSYMFTYCYSLKKIPKFNTSSVTNISGMFQYCQNLKEIPELDLSNVTNVQGFVAYNGSLEKVANLNLKSVENMSSMFSQCSSLETVGLIDCSSCINVANLFNSCNKIKNLGGFKDLGKAYLTTAPENNNNYTLTLTQSGITHDSLMNVINNLYDIKAKGCANQKLKLGVNNLPKLTEEEIAIANNKGWNVTQS